jgi:hypothetical protein
VTRDAVVLYSDFYKCPKCGHIDYSSFESLIADAKCPGCKAVVKWQRLEVYDVLQTLRKEQANVLRVPKAPPSPTMARAPLPPAPPLLNI